MNRLEVNRLVGGSNHAKDRQDRAHLPFPMEDLPEDACVPCLHFQIGLVGLDFEERVASADGLAFFLEPADDLAFGHALAGLGHQDRVCHGNPMRGQGRG